jgi:hypothetical protein
MNGRIGGQRPRPRVVLVGSFGADDVEHFLRMFPTVWRDYDIWRLEPLVDARELDLVVIASDVESAIDWPEKMHVICFSKDISRLPGPVANSYLRIPNDAQTEEFLFPDVPLSLSRRRDADYGNLTSVRGWPRVCLEFGRAAGRTIATKSKQEAAKKIFHDGAIICEHHTNSPLAVAFIRENNGLGIGWLPSVTANRAAWAELLVTQWAQSDKDAFPSFGDWINSPEWMVPEEAQIRSQIQALEQKKEEAVTEIDKQIGELVTKLALTKAEANNGLRRLITAQSEELVDEVAKALEDIGFDVTRVDELIGEKEPKREDLRLKHLGKGGEEWNAIVEVRGYARSGGTTADLLRLNRFADLYKIETGQTPDKRIYIVNGQLELLPSQRQEPLASATEDLHIFSETNGILIWSIDLFQAMKATNPSDYPALLGSIKYAQGRWVLVDVPSSKED